MSSLPFQTTPARADQKRALLVAPVFLPHSAVGATRWEQFIHRLSAMDGWAFDVLCEAPSATDKLDWARTAALPAGTSIFGVPRRRPLLDRAYSALRGAFGNRAPATSDAVTTVTSAGSAKESKVLVDQIRDLYGAWYFAALERSLVRHGGEILASLHSPPLLVISSGPPHEAHLLGAMASLRFQVPLVLDLRDPWFSGGALPAYLGGDPLSPTVEERTYKQASLILVNTARAGESLRRRFPSLHDRTVVLPNGTDIACVQPRPVDIARPFTIAHTGTLYIDRDPRPFLQAVATVVSHLRPTSGTFRVVFMGPSAVIEGRPLAGWAEDYGVSAWLEERPSGTRDEAASLLEEADMLLAFQGNFPSQIPAKIYEYLAYPARILALVGKESATADLLDGSSAIVLDLGDAPGIAGAILEAMLAHQRGERPAPINADGRFSRDRQASLLRQHLERLLQEA